MLAIINEFNKVLVTACQETMISLYRQINTRVHHNLTFKEIQIYKVLLSWVSVGFLMLIGGLYFSGKYICSFLVTIFIVCYKFRK